MGRTPKLAGRALLPAALALLGVLAALLLRGRAGQQVHQRELFAMDTFMTLTAWGPQGQEALDAAVEELRRLDALLSTGSAASEVSRLSREGGGPVSEDTAALLAASLEAYRATEGGFDPTVYPLMELWGFPTRDYRVPSAEEIAAVLPLVDASQIRLEGGQVALGPGQKLDFGGIAKGYAAARVMEVLRAHGVTSAMVSLGGNVQTLGRKPDGSPWRIGIQDPEAPQGAVLAAVEACDLAVVTSGGYQRYFEAEGRRYVHILDPRTGSPAESDLLSATVVSADGTLADALSTSLYILGREGAEALWRASGGSFDMVLVSEEGEVLVTEGLRRSFQPERPAVLLTLAGGRETLP